MSAVTPEQVEQSFQDLDFTQTIRRQIVDGISKQAIDNKDPELLQRTMQALDGMDKQSLGKLKINEKAKENETRADEAAAMAQYLVTLSERRQKEGLPETGHSEVVSRKLPDALRPSYDPAVRDAAPGSENTAEFTERVENVKSGSSK